MGYANRRPRPANGNFNSRVLKPAKKKSYWFVWVGALLLSASGTTVFCLLKGKEPVQEAEPIHGAESVHSTEEKNASATARKETGAVVAKPDQAGRVTLQNRAKGRAERLARPKSRGFAIPSVIDDGEYGPKIKGLRLGMKYNDVDAVVERLCNQYNSKPPRCAMYVDRSQKGMIVLRPKMSEIKDPRFLSPCLFDDDGKLVEYGLRGEVFEVAFGLEPYKVSPEEVVQKFLDSYGIPSSNTRVYTFGSSSIYRGGCVETVSYYDGSENGGYSFGFCGRKVGYWELSFTVHRYLGLDFDLPEQISMSDVKNYQHGFGPVIKGFQLGMTRSEVLTSLRKINIVPEEKGDWMGVMMNAFRPRISFVFKNGKVSEFRIAGDLLVFLFRAEPYYQDIRDFTRQAINFYHVPEVSGKSRSNSREIATCYEHRMRDEYTGKAIEFWIEELRMANSSYWTIGCRQIDFSNFD